MRWLIVTLLAGWTFNALAQNEQTLARIERVESGLLGPVSVHGVPRQTMQLLERMRALHVPGVSIAVINHGELEWARAYGVSDVDSGKPVTTDTLFQAGSISKPVVAVAMLRLAEQGTLPLDEDINVRLHSWHLPPSPLTAQHPVTARGLLSHTAGILAYDLEGYRSDQLQPTLLQVLQGVPPAKTPAVVVRYEPGCKYDYSSLGYGVLQQYAIDVTGEPFDQLMRQTILKPLGMDASLYAQSLPSILAGHAASGHAGDGTALPGKWRSHPEFAANGLWTTPSDLAHFVIAIQRAAAGDTAAVLPQALVRQMLTPIRNDYGLGLELDHAGAEPTFHHSGSTPGYKALLFAYTRTGQGAVIMTNGDYGSTLIEEIMRSIAVEYGWGDYKPIERVATAGNPALFDRFTGVFSVSNTTLRFTRDGNHLYVDGPPIGPVRAELIPAGDYDFFIRERDAAVHFDANGTEPVVTLTFVDGHPRPGRRLSSSAQH